MGGHQNNKHTLLQQVKFEMTMIKCFGKYFGQIIGNVIVYQGTTGFNASYMMWVTFFLICHRVVAMVEIG